MKILEKLFEKNNIGNELNSDDTFAHIFWFIKKNPFEFLTKTQTELGSLIHVSQPSIVRFVKKAGFDSFREMQIYLAEKFQEFIPQFDLEFKENENISEAKKNVFIQYSNLVKIILNSIDDTVMSQVVEDIVKTKKVVFIGIGSNGDICSYYARQFLKFGVQAQAIVSIHDFIDEANSLIKGKNHFILISRSFSTREIVMMYKILLEYKCEITVLTQNTTNTFIGVKNKLYYDYFLKRSFAFDIGNKTAIYMILDIIFNNLIYKVDPKLKNIEFSRALQRKLKI